MSDSSQDLTKLPRRRVHASSALAVLLATGATVAGGCTSGAANCDDPLTCGSLDDAGGDGGDGAGATGGAGNAGEAGTGNSSATEPCGDTECPPNATCEGEGESAQCICTDGYVGAECTDCEEGYGPVEGGQCLEEQTVPCTDPAVKNATALEAEVTIRYVDDAWETPPECEWECLEGTVEENESCVLAVTPRYISAPGWGDAVRGNDTKTPCDGTETGRFGACVPGGPLREVPAPGQTSCENLSLKDELNAFTWLCHLVEDKAIFRTTGFADGQGLHTLLHFETPAWKENRVTLTDETGPFAQSELAVWWDTPVKALPTAGGFIKTAGVYTVGAGDSGDGLTLTGPVVIDADKVALVTHPDAELRAPLNADTGLDEIALVEVKARNFVSIHGDFNALGFARGLLLSGTRFADLSGVRVTDAGRATTDGAGIELTSGASANRLSDVAIHRTQARWNEGAPTETAALRLTDASENTLTRIVASGNSGSGVLLQQSNKNLFRDLRAVNNGEHGIHLQSSNENVGVAIVASNNGSGVTLTASHNNALAELIATGNIGGGVVMWSAENNWLTTTLAANNDIGVALVGSHGTALSTMIAGNNATSGIHVGSTTGAALTDFATAHNGAMGLRVTDSVRTVLSQFVSTGSGKHGLELAGVSRETTVRRGALYANQGDGLNITGNAPADPISDTSLEDVLSIQNGGDGVLLGPEVDLASATFKDMRADSCGVGTPGAVNCNTSSSLPPRPITAGFVGGVIMDDPQNGSDTDGAAEHPGATPFDWTRFRNAYCTWGRDGTAFPSDMLRGRWTAGLGRIWDWSLSSSAQNPFHEHRAVADAVSLLTGTEHSVSPSAVATHTWSNRVDEEACASRGEWVDDRCTTTFLRYAREVLLDGFGNDDALCQAGETCVFAPNLGAYQGHGGLAQRGAYSSPAEVPYVVLLEHAMNGR